LFARENTKKNLRGESILKKRSFMARLFKKSQDDKQKSLENLDKEEKEMIKGVVELSDSIVREVMVPRTDTIFISLDMTINELLPRVVDSGHSRFPVYQGTNDNVVGILYAKDLLSCLIKKNRDFKIKDIIRKPYFVPESMKLNSLLKEFRRRKVHIAIVVDEYGGTSGVVCLENIIEEIVGEIQDEFDNETEEVLKIGEGIYLCDARINLEDLNEKLNLKLPTDDFDSLGGFVFDLFGKIPAIHEKASYNNLDFVIQRMEGRKILNVKLTVKRQEKDDNKK